MSLRLYNSLGRVEQEFVPKDPNKIGLYVCGPTVYDRAHVGNARPVVVFDVLFRLLRARYGDESITYVRNITDVDDKIIAAAATNNETIEALTQRTTDFYHADMGALGCLPPTTEPRATQHIDQMIAMTKRLIDLDHAYEAERHILFSVESSTDYGALSGRNRDEQIAGARVEVAPYKRDPADFVLWKPSHDGEPGWSSPWGQGRPGWHIECSAMAETHLGETFDIHGGGIDLIFPHHENEIAQSSCAHGGAPLARFWMHNGHVMVDGQKMSKSLGNFITVEELLKRWPGEVIRMALLSAHYRQPLDITETLLAASKARLDYLYGVLRRNPSQDDKNEATLTALNDDLNTPQALSDLQELGRAVEAGQQTSSSLVAAGTILGLLQASPEDWFRWQRDSQNSLSAQEIDDFIVARKLARANKNFAEADRIRDDLLGKGILLEDSSNGTIWRSVV